MCVWRAADKHIFEEMNILSNFQKRLTKFTEFGVGNKEDRLVNGG
jgi:hypothetical protein